MLSNDFFPIRGDSSSKWSRAQDKQFERALVEYAEETPDRWQKIAAEVPGKTAWEVREHYEALVHDVLEIDSGRVQLPSYVDDYYVDDDDDDVEATWRTSRLGGRPERKRGVPWTEEEHRRFLIGLKEYGRGDWRTISRMAVVSRTPTQVASHAQKYFLRMNSLKERKRSSIHDITTTTYDQGNTANNIPSMTTNYPSNLNNNDNTSQSSVDDLDQYMPSSHSSNVDNISQSLVDQYVSSLSSLLSS
ncbi:hypothetical protein Syun_002511 [Stephania yunnanensis]|uniref:Uncharacterized protein n=1 Tax=Stephania yunnanensis TaxID=152371 RepID=A0AAP0LFY0_9MAGN